MMKKRWVSLLLTALILLSFTACNKVVVKVPADVLLLFGNQNGGANSAAGNDAYQPVVTPTPTQAPVTVPTTASQTPAGNTPTNNAATSNAPATSANTPAASSSGAPSTKDEIIAYYVAAYNKIATDSKSITRTYDYTANYKNIVEVGGNDAIAKVAKQLMDANMKENNDKVTGTIQDVAPKGLASITITPAQVSEATCTENGGNYVITLKSTGTDENPELDCQPGQGSAGVIGPLLRTEDVSGGAAGMVEFQGLHAKYPQGKVTATIDKASGHITELKFDCPCILHFDSATVIKVLKVQNTELGLQFMQTWEFTY